MTYGWFFVLFFPVSCVQIFPEVRIITQDVHRAKAECWYGYDNISDRKTFFVDRYYVPFRYKGAKYMPGKSYLINDTDSTLVLYPVYFYSGLYSDKNISRHEAMAVRPHSSNQWSKGIDNHFHTPYEHFFYPGKTKRGGACGMDHRYGSRCGGRTEEDWGCDCRKKRTDEQINGK